MRASILPPATASYVLLMLAGLRRCFPHVSHSLVGKNQSWISVGEDGFTGRIPTAAGAARHKLDQHRRHPSRARRHAPAECGEAKSRKNGSQPGTKPAATNFSTASLTQPLPEAPRAPGVPSAGLKTRRYGPGVRARHGAPLRRGVGLTMSKAGSLWINTEEPRTARPAVRPTGCITVQEATRGHYNRLHA